MAAKYGKLFWSMFVLSAFTLGNGFVIIPLMQRRFVEELGWLEEDEMLDMVAFARSSPGAVTVNVAVQAGLRVAGPAGAVWAVVGTILPPLGILALISVFYDAFRASALISAILFTMRAAVAAVVVDAVLPMIARVLRNRDYLHWAVLAISAALALLTKVNAVVILLLSVALGAVFGGRREACSR